MLVSRFIPLDIDVRHTHPLARSTELWQKQSSENEDSSTLGGKTPVDSTVPSGSASPAATD